LLNEAVSHAFSVLRDTQLLLIKEDIGYTDNMRVILKEDFLKIPEGGKLTK
jgi:hypothetical protein